MKTHSEIIINKPVKEVWDFFDNPENMKKWLRGFKSFEMISGNQGEPGARAKHVYEEKGRTIEVTEEITRRVPYEEFSGTLYHKYFMSYIENKFDDLGDGRTSIIVDSEIRFKSLPWNIMGAFMKKTIQERQDEDLKRLKEAVEGE